MRGERKLSVLGWLLTVSSGVMVLVTSVAGPLSEPAEASDTASIYTAAAAFSGPFTVGHVIEPLTALPTDLASHDYVEQEFSAAGTAHAFRATSAPSDGKWSITPTSSAPYRTRILVRRPANPKDFSGTVVVEWMNESAGESAPDWDYLNPEIMDAGDAWVGVSAQSLGVDGGKSLLSGGKVTGAVQGLTQQEPQRYGSLHQPGDQYSFDIYDQIAFGLRHSPSMVLGPLHPHHILAVGESQSASYLTTFADSLEPHDYPYDGIFIHSRGVSGAPLDGGSITARSVQTPLLIRTDLRVPVFMSRDADRLDHAGLCACPTTEHRPHPNVGDRRDLPRRYLRGGRKCEASWGVRRPSTPVHSTWWYRRPSLTSVGGSSTGTPPPSPLRSSCRAPIRRRSHSTRMAT